MATTASMYGGLLCRLPRPTPLIHITSHEIIFSYCIISIYIWGNRYRNVKPLAQYHTASKWQSRELTFRHSNWTLCSETLQHSIRKSNGHGYRLVEGPWTPSRWQHALSWAAKPVGKWTKALGEKGGLCDTPEVLHYCWVSLRFSPLRYETKVSASASSLGSVLYHPPSHWFLFCSHNIPLLDYRTLNLKVTQFLFF